MTAIYTHIAFDLDGTLIDSIPAMQAAYASFLETFGILPDPAEFDALNGPSLPEIISYLKTRYGLPRPEPDLLSLYIERIHTAYLTETVPMPGSSEVLRALATRGISLALATSAPRGAATQIITRNGWDSLFEIMAFGDECPRGKPWPDIYLHAAALAGAPPEIMLAVEDSPKGVAAAKSAGMTVAGFTSGEHASILHAAGADHIIDCLEDLLTLPGVHQ